MTRKSLGFVAGTVGLATFLCVPSTAWAQVAPPSGVWRQFGALAATAVTGSTGSGTAINGDVGSFPTPAITNFPPSSVNAPFIIHNSADAIVQQAQTDARAAYNFLAAQGGAPLPLPPAPDELGGRTLGPGVYSFGAANLANSTTLTLNGAGIFIFNVASTLTMNTLSAVTGTANPCNVYWRVGTSATLNGNSFVGTVFADVSITLGGGNVSGRLLALTGAVTMPGSGGNTIGGCSVQLSPPGGCPPITISPATLPGGTVGVAYAQTLVGSGGTVPYTFTVIGGVLPPGLTLTPFGVLSGTPTTAGPSLFTIRATDANGCSATIGYLVTIAPAPVPPPVCPVITISPPTLPGGTVGVAYLQTISASGGTPPYSFGVSVGTLPPGLTLTPGGTLAGTPTVAGSFSFQIRALDAAGCFAVRDFIIVVAAAPPPPPVCPPITINPITLPNGTVGTFYSQTLTGSGGTAPYVFGLSAGSLAPGLLLTAAGLISGTPNEVGTSAFIIRGTDANGCFAERAFVISVTLVPVPTLPQVFVVLLALGLTAAGYFRLRQRARAE